MRTPSPRGSLQVTDMQSAITTQPWITVDEIPGLFVPYSKTHDEGHTQPPWEGADAELSSSLRPDTSILRDDVELAKTQIHKHAQSVMDKLPAWMFCDTTPAAWSRTATNAVATDAMASDGREGRGRVADAQVKGSNGSQRNEQGEESEAGADGEEYEVAYGNHNVADEHALEDAVNKLAKDDALNSELSGTGILRDIAAEYARLVRAATRQLGDSYKRERDAARTAIASTRRDQYASLVHSAGECARVHARLQDADRQLGRRESEFQAQYQEPLRQALQVWREYVGGIRSVLVESSRSILQPIFGVQSDMAAERGGDLQNALESGARFVVTLTAEPCTIDQILDQHLPQLEGVLNILREKTHKLIQVAGASAAQYATDAVTAGVPASEIDDVLSLNEAGLRAELGRREEEVRQAYVAAYPPAAAVDAGQLRLAEVADAGLAFARRIQSGRGVLEADRPGVMAARQVLQMLQEVRLWSGKVRERLDAIRTRVKGEGLPLRTARREARDVAQTFIARQRDGVRAKLDARAARVVEDVRRAVDAFASRAAVSLDATVAKVERLMRHIDEVCVRVHMHRDWGEITAGAAALKAQIMRVAGLWVSSIRSCVRALLRDVTDSALEQARSLQREVLETERKTGELMRPPAESGGADQEAAALWV